MNYLENDRRFFHGSVEMQAHGRPSDDRSLRLMNVIIMLIAGLIMFSTVLAGPVGLGIGADFLFYRLWGITRSSLFCIGFILILPPIVRVLYRLLPASSVSQISPLFSAFFYVLKEELRTRRSTAAASSFGIFIGQFTVMFVVATMMLWLNRYDIMGYIDGHYLLTLSNNRADFAGEGLVFSSNPLQGLSEPWYTTANTEWIPELAVMRLVSDVAWKKVAVHAVVVCELFSVVVLTVFWLGGSRLRAFVSGWLAVLVLTPLTYPALVYNIQGDNPQLMLMAVFPLLVLCLWSGIGQGSIYADFVRASCLAALFWWHLISVGLATALDYPFLVIAISFFWIGSWVNRTEFARKAVWGAALLLFFVVSGFPQILLGLIRDSAFHMFPGEMARSDQQLSLGSLLFRIDEPIGMALAILGVIGAALESAFGRGRMRQLAGATLLFACLVYAASIVVSFGISGAAIPIYYELSIWALYAIFAATLLIAIGKMGRNYILAGARRCYSQNPKWFALIFPVAALVVLHGPNYLRGLHNDRPNVFPPRPTALSEFLQDQIGISPGKPFRGRAATMTGQQFPPGATWEFHLFGMDMNLIREVGNDHRTIGLWYYNVPTLTAFSVTTPPTLYALVKRYLAVPGDVQGRHILTMRRPDLGILQLLGVRYLVTDSREPVGGSKRVKELAVRGKERLFVDEMIAPNLGFSPTEIKSVPENQMLNWIGDNRTALNRVVALSGSLPGSIVEAYGIEITFQKGELRVRAKSSGRSVVVIPFQFSNCLRVGRSEKTPELRRADLLLTAIIFERELDAALQYRQGPFESYNCRLADEREDARLLETYLMRRDNAL